MRVEHDARGYGELVPGTRVEVHCRYDRRWSGGFEIVAAEPSGYRLRRLSDGVELPVTFDEGHVRVEAPASAL